MSRQHGFSLLELLCVLAILSILAHMGSLHFLHVSQQAQDQNTLKTEMKRLADALTQARQLAVLSGQTSFVCGGIRCVGDWSLGFMLYQLESRTGAKNAFRQIAFDPSVTVLWHGFPIKKQQIEFLPNGLSGYQNGTFSFCLGTWQADLVLNQSGRFYLSDPQPMVGGQCG
ncbi:type IV fimbrial biogenesis protein FimT [Marinomonas alcarazii]|uniref:Type II secretion system protein H n=1 Tax=Marinomonas alcarazii TaxID=491949 RepID=A0A318VGU3_9GAMM|nr:GspH/FimT family pseudopilin [Marinomonas alcarazii]PYF83119.1 type IV fimbrial biogenesis protein FimT [Marinomonas alcarazii]